MFQQTDEELTNLGAIITTREIQQQPELWQEASARFEQKQAEISHFFEMIKQDTDGPVRVIFTGAGTSQYIGDTLVPYLNQSGDTENFSFESIGTTDIVATPQDYLKKTSPTLLVSFARSGNSPESLAAVRLADQLVDTIYHLTITCAEDGQLAKHAQTNERHLLLLMPERANDAGFAMTGSFTCMLMTALLTFDLSELSKKMTYIADASKLGQEVIARENEIRTITEVDFERIVYLGSGSLAGLTREAQLKVLELTAGEIATVFDSSMGFRHGPKSFVNKRTLVFGFLNNDPYTRKYDLDILEEVSEDKIAANTVAIGQKGNENFSGNQFTFTTEASQLPEAYLVLPEIMVAQTIALFSSVKVGNTPDTPSATGTVNRVVKGVTIHPYKS
ncbi:tagatose-6-phosphate ketose isomerase [Enterococcus sp. JM4C]|uniref:SIS domain-containing protein n=1 Tax=Candidatus Enterococcus huntleyi TaxID=1857217 RepID=UPI00137A5A2F|nr:SIS domain-containing protein [Enterococcus sp. JM4C]KAF1295677.1 tagatose-6-phosphate ketose isomerase [Enterococcus sp. JM4C]